MSNNNIEASVSVIKADQEADLAVGSFRVSVDPQETSFQVLKNPGTGEILVHGENDRMEYEGLTEPDQSQYVMGYFDPKTNKLRIQPTCVVSMSSVVKSKKRARGPAVKQANVKNIAQRTALGEAFGTKKAKKAISDVEKNRVDADQLADLEAAIVDTVQSNTSTLPSAVQRAEALSSERPIPPYNLEATKPEDVYVFADGIVSIAELNAIKGVLSTVESLDEGYYDDILALLPSSTPAYLNTKILDALKGISKNQKIEHLAEIYYAALLFSFYANRRAKNKLSLIEKLGNSPPDALVSGLLSKFAVSKTGYFGKQKDKSFAVDPASENKLLCYLLAVVLRINGYTIAVPPLSQELSIKPSKVAELFKALGCSIKPPTKTQAEALGIAKSDTYKVASLSVPFKLPDVAKRVRGGGR